MAITTMDGLIAGLRPTSIYTKASISGISQSTATKMTGHWYANGTPAGSTATAIGVDGEAVTPALGSVLSRIGRTNPVSGNSYLANLSVKKGSATLPSASTIILVDRLWQNSGLSTTLTTAQAINPATLPARDRNASTNGNGVLAAIEWSAVGGAGTPTVSLTYTGSDGTTGRTATFTAVTTPPAGTVEFFTLDVGDVGIRAPTSFIQSATRTSGTMHLVLFRILAVIPADSLTQSSLMDAIQLAMPRIYDDSVLQLLTLSNTISGGISAQITETQG